MDKCQNCQNPISAPATGRKPEYCSNACKQRAYRHEMLDNFQHEELSERLQRLADMAILSGYDCELYRRLFAGWRMIQRDTRTNGNFEATECLWINPACDAARSNAGAKVAI